MNRVDKIINEIRNRISRCNFNLEMYGRRSYEYQITRITINTFLDALQISGVIDDYDFKYGDFDIISVNIYLGEFITTISEESVHYDISGTRKKI